MVKPEFRISVEGELDEFPFPRVLQFLHEMNVTGRLVIRRGTLTKVVFMVSGNPVNVDSTLRDETLGRYLIKKGKISEEEYEKSIQLMINENMQQGAALVKMGIMSPKELYHEVKAQSREKLLSCFAWTTGTFDFYPEVDFVEDIYRFEASVPLAMKEGIYRYFPSGAIEKQFAKAGAGPILPIENLMEIINDYEPADGESAFIFMIDGEKDLLALKSECASSPQNLKFLYLLLLCGLIGPEGKPDKNLRTLGGKELKLPPIEEIMSSDTAPEVVFEERLVDDMEDEILDDYDIDGSGTYQRLRDYSDEEILDDWDSATPREIDEAPKEYEAGIQKTGDPGDKREESDILETYMSLKSLNFFDLLGIAPDSDDLDVEKSYRTIRSNYDKNKFVPDLSEEALNKLEEIHARFIRAYEELRTEENRAEYLKKLKKPSEQSQASPALMAEKYLQKGVSFVRSREWGKAQEMFELAVEKRPQEPEYLGYLGWTIFSNIELDEEHRTSRAKSLIMQAIEINPQMDSSHVFFAKILKQEGNFDAAVSEFRSALACNPKCREAERELEAYTNDEW